MICTKCGSTEACEDLCETIVLCNACMALVVDGLCEAYVDAVMGELMAKERLL